MVDERFRGVSAGNGNDEEEERYAFYKESDNGLMFDISKRRIPETCQLWSVRRATLVGLSPGYGLARRYNLMKIN